jgi:DNA-binding MarR family transcriptional regulator
MTGTDYLTKLGALAIASRLGRLLRRLQGDGELVYQSLGLDFKPSWFPVLRLLSTHAPLSLTEMAQMLSVAHPALLETVNELVHIGLVSSEKSHADGEHGRYALSKAGIRKCEELKPVWSAFEAVGQEVVTEGDNDFMGALGTLEHALDEHSMYERMMKRLRAESGI